MSGNKVGVFLCQGGGSKADTSEFRRLRWWAQAGFPEAGVYEITRACQPKGMQGIAQLCADNSLDTVVLGACALSRDRSGLAEAMRAQNAELKEFRELDLCLSPKEGLEACQVAPQAQLAIKQLAAELDSPVVLQCETMPFTDRVLVIGSGLAALKSAVSLARAGHGVVLITPTARLSLPEPIYGPEARALAEDLKREVEADAGIEVIRDAELLSLSGSVGVFEAVILDVQGKRQHLNIGAVLFCQGPPQVMNLSHEPNPKVMPLDGLLALLAAPEHFKKRFEGGSLRVGIALGMEKQTYPAYLAAACRAGLDLLTGYDAQVTIFTDYAKVAQPGLEALTQEVRDEGGVLVKFSQESPRFSISDDGVSAEYVDEIAEVGLRQELDILALDTRSAPDAAWLRLVGRLGLEPNPQGYVADSRPGLAAGETARKGIYALGAAAGPMSLDQLQDQLSYSVAEVGRLLKDEASRPQLNQVKVDRKKCALCLTCVRVCPTGAMGKAARRPQSNPLACTGCGTCASECPMDAIQLINLEDDRLNKVIKAGLDEPDAWTPPSEQPEVLVIACANSAVRSLRKARAQGMALPPGVRLVEVPCAGKVDPDLVLRAIREGYDLIQVVSCHPEACYSLEGNTWAGYREDHLRQLLNEAGLESSRLVWDHVAPGMARAAYDLVDEAVKKAAELGPNPLKAAAKVRDLLSKFTLKMDDTFTLVP